jgi:SulP family sulfate permease
VRFAASLEKGLEWCENQILQQSSGLQEQPPSLLAQLSEILPDTQYLSQMLPYLEEMDVEAGYCLIRQGDFSRDLFFIRDGQVTTILDLAKEDPVRLGTIGGGVVGEVGFYLGRPRTASVVTDVPSKLYRLSRENLQRLEIENPQAAANMHCVIAHLLSERVAHLVKAVTALER